MKEIKIGKLIERISPFLVSLWIDMNIYFMIYFIIYYFEFVTKSYTHLTNNDFMKIMLEILLRTNLYFCYLKWVYILKLGQLYLILNL